MNDMVRPETISTDTDGTAPPARTEPMRVLLLEDVPTDVEITLRELRKVGVPFVSKWVDTRERFVEALQEFQPDLILSDFSLPASFDGLAALAIARKTHPDVPYVFVSGTIGEDRAVEALKRGATDYVLKDRLNRLIPVIKRALNEKEEREARRRAEDAARESEQKLRLMIDGVKDYALLLLDCEGRVASWNPGAERISGYAEDEILGRHCSYFHTPDDVAKAEQILRVASETGRHEDEGWRVRKDGSRFWANVVITAIRDNAGALQGYAKVTRDITETRSQRERILRLSRIRAVRSGVNSAIVRVSARAQLLQDACRIIVGDGGLAAAWIGTVDPSGKHVRPEMWAGRGLDFLPELTISVPPEPDAPDIVAQSVHLRQPVIVNDIRRDARAASGQPLLERGFVAAATFPLVVEAKVAGVLVLYGDEPRCFDEEQVQLLEELASDISFGLDHIAKEERLNYLAYYDGLTGLANRTLFQQQVLKLIHSVSPSEQGVAMVVLDLERFRNINDTMGMAAGDTVLKQFADRLSSAVGEPGAVARISADRYAVALVPMRNATQIARVLDRQVFVSMHAAFPVKGEELRLSMKAGVAVYPADGADPATLLVNAEVALAKAKQTTERYLFYAPDMNARVAEQLRLENELRKAVLEEQFVLYYQPRIDLPSGRVTGMEALIRWQHPERGLISPAAFIPLLEQTGMIIDIGRWALRRAALDHATWEIRGHTPPRIAVNVSEAQLRREEFVDDVRSAIQAPGGSGNCIDIEITESMLMDDIDRNIEKLRAVRALGIHVAIDDFGTGYSSLSWIARLPLDSLKIDRSFIASMADSAEHMAIVSAVISLARALNLKVVAEGVETEAQCNLLQLLRCDEGQGYLFHVPLPPDEVPQYLARHNAL